MDHPKLRVLVAITRGEPGGAQVHVRDLVCGLRDRVHFEVVVGDDAFLAEELRAAGVTVHVLPDLQREIAPRRDWRALRALSALVAKLRPHLVHTHSSKAGQLGRLAAASRGVVAIHTAHAWSFSDGIRRRRKALAIPLEAAMGRLTRRFIVVSEADREIAVRYHVARADQLRIVHNGVRDTPERARHGFAAVPVVAMVARMADPKQHTMLLRAIAGVDAPWRVRFIGDGPDRAAVEATIAELGIGNRVDLLGVRSDVDVLLADSQIGALVSRQEGFPLAILEAMRAGLPVIASDVGGVREAVEHEVTGLLVPRDDEPALQAALLRLVADGPLRTKMGAAGRAAYEAKFTVKSMLEGTAAVYTELAREEGWPAVAA